MQHHAVLRRADIDPPQLVLGGHLALDEFADLVVGLAQILGDVADHVLVDLDDLQLGLGDLALGLGARGDVLRALAVEPRGVALQRGQPRNLHQMLVVEIADAGEFLFAPARFPGPWPSPAPRGRAISSFSCVIRSRNCAFCPVRPVVRTSNSLVSLAITFLTSGSPARSSSVCGNVILSRPLLLGLQPRRARPASRRDSW